MKALCYDIPLREGFMAQLVLPSDLTRQECDKLRALLETLVIPTEKARGETPHGIPTGGPPRP